MTRENELYFYISKDLRYKNLISYLKESSLYSDKDIALIYKSEKSKLVDHMILLGYLVQSNIQSYNKTNIIESSRNESNFRNLISNAMKDNKSNKIKILFNKLKISVSQISIQANSQDFLSFSFIRFLDLAISKKDSKIIDILKKRKILAKKDLQEIINKK